eukprot:g10481.t1
MVNDSFKTETYRTQDEYAVTLQNLLATESAEKEMTQAELYKWKKTIDGHRRHLLSLCQDGMDQRGENVWKRLQDEVKTFEEDLHRLQVKGAHEDGEGGEARRSESLNTDMVAQQEANAQLVGSLTTCKNNNKELLEQIQTQTAEITRITQERIADEQKMELMQRHHNQEEDSWKQDGYRRLHVLRDQGDERYSTSYNHLTSKLKFVEARASVLKEEAEGLQMQANEQRTQVAGMKQQMVGSFQGVNAKMLQEMDAKDKLHRATREKLKEKIKDMELKLMEEHEFHGHEVSSWSHRYVGVQAEKEDLQARMDREVSMLSAQKQGLGRTVKAELNLYESELKKLKTTITDCHKAKGELEKQLDDAKREVFRLQSVYGSVETEVQCKETVVSDLRKQLREADDALSAAVAGNEHLRCQMEEQRLRFVDMNEGELARLRNSYEEKVQKLKEQQQNETQLLEFQIKSLEEVLSEKEAQRDRLMKMTDQLQGECGALERDVAVWKGTFDQGVRNRHELEREYALCRQEWARQKLTVIETTETNDSKRQTLETELKFLTDSYVDYKRQAATKETELQGRINSFEDVLKTTKAHQMEAQASLRDVLDAIAKTKQDASLQLQISTETCCQLERDLEQKKLEYEKWREQHAVALRQVSEESSAKIQALEDEKRRREEQFAKDETTLQTQVQSLSAKGDKLKHEAARLRYGGTRCFCHACTDADVALHRRLFDPQQGALRGRALKKIQQEGWGMLREGNHHEAEPEMDPAIRYAYNGPYCQCQSSHLYPADDGDLSRAFFEQCSLACPASTRDHHSALFPAGYLGDCWEHRTELGKQASKEVQRSAAAISTPKRLLDHNCPVWAGFWCAQSLRDIGEKHPHPKSKAVEEPKKVKVLLGRLLEDEDAKTTIKQTLEQKFAAGAVEIKFTDGMGGGKRADLFDVGQQEPSSADEAEDAGTAAGNAQVNAALASGINKKYEEPKNDPRRECRQFFRENNILEKVEKRAAKPTRLQAQSAKPDGAAPKKRVWKDWCRRDVVLATFAATTDTRGQEEKIEEAIKSIGLELVTQQRAAREGIALRLKAGGQFYAMAMTKKELELLKKSDAAKNQQGKGARVEKKGEKRKMVRLKVFGQPKIPSALLESLRSLPGLPPVNPEEEEIPARTYPKGELLPMSIKKRSGLETWVGSTLHTKSAKVNKGRRDCVTIDATEQFYNEVLRKAVSFALQQEPRWGTTEIRTDYKTQSRLIAVATHDDVLAIADALNPVNVIVYGSPDPAHCVQDVLQKATLALGIPQHAPVFVPHAMHISPPERDPSTACSRTKAVCEQLKKLHDESFHGCRRSGMAFATATSDPEEVVRLVENALANTTSRAVKFREQVSMGGTTLRAINIYHKTEAELRSRLGEEMKKVRTDNILPHVQSGYAREALQEYWTAKKKEKVVHAGKLQEVPDCEKIHAGWETDALRGKGKEKKAGVVEEEKQVKKPPEAKKKKKAAADQKTGAGRTEAGAASTASQALPHALARGQDNRAADVQMAEAANATTSAVQDGERRVNKYVTAVSVADDAARRESLSRDFALVQQKEKTEYVSRSAKNKKNFPFLLLSLLNKGEAFSVFLRSVDGELVRIHHDAAGTTITVVDFFFSTYKRSSWQAVKTQLGKGEPEEIIAEIRSVIPAAATRAKEWDEVVDKSQAPRRRRAQWGIEDRTITKPSTKPGENGGEDDGGDEAAPPGSEELVWAQSVDRDLDEWYELGRIQFIVVFNINGLHINKEKLNNLRDKFDILAVKARAKTWSAIVLLSETHVVHVQDADTRWVGADQEVQGKILSATSNKECGGSSCGGGAVVDVRPKAGIRTSPPPKTSAQWTITTKKPNLENLVMDVGRKEDCFAWLSAAVEAETGMLAVQVYIPQRKLAAEEEKWIESQIHEVVQWVRTERRKAAAYIVGGDINYQHDAQSPAALVRAVKSSGQYNEATRKAAALLLQGLLENTTALQLHEATTYRGVTTPDFLAYSGPLDAGRQNTFLACWDKGDEVPRWKDWHQAQLIDQFQDHAAIVLSVPVRGEDESGIHEEQESWKEGKWWQKMWKANAKTPEGLRKDEDMEAIRNAIKPCELPRNIFGRLDEFHLTPRNYLPGDGLAMATEEEKYAFAATPIKTRRDEPLTAQQIADVYREADADLRAAKSSHDYEEILAQAMLRLGFAAPRHVSRSTNTATRAKQPDAVTGGIMSRTKNEFFGLVRGEPVSTLEGISVDGYKMSSNFTALLNVVRYFLRKPAETKALLGVGFGEIDCPQLLQKISAVAKNAKKITFTDEHFVQALKEMNSEVQGPHGVRVKVLQGMPLRHRRHFLNLYEEELEKIRLHSNPRSLYTCIQQPLMLATFLAKGSKVQTASKLRTVYTDALANRGEDKLLGDMTRDAQYEEGATSSGFASGGIHRVSLSSATIRRAEQAAWIHWDQKVRRIMKVSCDMRMQFDTQTPRVLFVVNRSLGLPPHLLLRNLLSLAQRKAIFSSGGLHLKASRCNYCMQGAAEAMIVGSVLLAPLLRAIKNFLVRIYNESFQLGDIAQIQAAEQKLRDELQQLRKIFASEEYTCEDVAPSNLAASPLGAAQTSPSRPRNIFRLADVAGLSSDEEKRMNMFVADAHGVVDDTEISIPFESHNVADGKLRAVVSPVLQAVEDYAEISELFLAADKCETVFIGAAEIPEAAFSEAAQAVEPVLGLFGRKIAVKKCIKLFGQIISQEVRGPTADTKFVAAVRQQIFFGGAMATKVCQAATTLTSSQVQEIHSWLTTARCRHLLVDRLVATGSDKDAVLINVLEQINISRLKLLGCSTQLRRAAKSRNGQAEDDAPMFEEEHPRVFPPAWEETWARDPAGDESDEDEEGWAAELQTELESPEVRRSLKAVQAQFRQIRESAAVEAEE